MLFDSISQNEKLTITWNDFLDFLMKNMYPNKETKLRFGKPCIETVAHGKNESVAKIVLIETDKYFCYAMVLKHGRVGLYDGNLNFLTSYHAIITREDITRPEDERRRRNRWITDAIFCPDVMMFIIASTARTLSIYEASGLKHVPYWLIISTPNILQCLAYKPYKDGKQRDQECILFCGDDNGEVISFTFLQPKNELLLRQRNEDMVIFYWDVLLRETKHVLVKKYGKIHQDYVKHIQYYHEMEYLVTCSRDSVRSLVIKYMGNKRKSAVFKMLRGVSCFALSNKYKFLITGSENGIIRIWNPVLTSKPIASISEHQSDVLDIRILEQQALFITCSRDGVLKLWDLKEHVCLQSLRLKFPVFRVQGKLIEWGINCIYPGPKRQNPNHSDSKENKKNCFGIENITEMKNVDRETPERSKIDIWERSFILIVCCNCFAKIRLDFDDPNIELNFSCPVLPPPPLQSSVLIPADWPVLNDSSGEKGTSAVAKQVNTEERRNEIDFILNRRVMENNFLQSTINQKIALLESEKEKMIAKVAKGAPYLALDLASIEELKLSYDLPLPRNKKSEKNFQKIQYILDDATVKSQLFSKSSSSNSKSSRSSILQF